MKISLQSFGTRASNGAARALFALVAALMLLAPFSASGAALGGTITEQLVNLRSGPSALDAVLMELPLGTRVDVVREGTSWHMVKVKGVSGYVSASAMQVDGEIAPPPRLYASTVREVSLRSKPNGSKIGKKVSDAAQVELIHYEKGWFRIKAKDSTGYVSAKDLAGYDMSPPGGAKYSATALEKLTLYAEPSTRSTAMANVPESATIYVLRTGDEFAQIEYADMNGYALLGGLRVYFAARTPEIGAGADSVDYSDHGKGKIVNTKVQNFSYQMLLDAISSLKKRFPQRLSVSSLGTSTAGRDIPMLILGNPQAPKRIWVDASMHAREHMCTQIVMDQIEFLLNNYESGVFEGKRLRDTMDEVALFIVPMGNPDGVELVQRGLSSVSDPAQRAYLFEINGGSDDFSRWKANIRGVDLVSNFDAKWAEKATSSQIPAPYGYKGEAPLTEVESRLCAQTIENLGFNMTISYHAVGAELYWWFGQEGARQDRDFDIAMGFADLTGYTLISKERSLTDSAGLKDWAIQTFKQPGITVELGPTTSIAPVPIGDYQQIWERNRFVLWHAANLFAG